MIEPDVEDLCRDRLIDILRPKLSALALCAKREVDMKNHKLADIVVQNSFFLTSIGT
ncbi:hypothetical protein [uncultured Shewanella sp.]|uniref:hypothetical protein n=1 Tax=uncultured Shewanella sp. TaxID=173975 RepID=UPI00261784A6|nr:hypothetical protein [uncultured Shewanella sp.]